MGIFLLNPPEPCCEPTRPEHVGISSSELSTGDGRCGLCDCVPPKWKLTIPPVLAGGFLDSLGLPPSTSNGDANALTYILIRRPWDPGSASDLFETCRWSSDLLVNQFSGIDDVIWSGIPIVSRFQLTWGRHIGGVLGWVIFDYGWFRIRLGGDNIEGARYRLWNTSVGDNSNFYFRCLGRNTFQEFDFNPSTGTTIQIEPWYE